MSPMRMKPDFLYVADSPKLQELCALTIHVPQILDSNIPTIQPEVIKCRELIFTEADILAAPVLAESGGILLILHQRLYKTGRLQTRLLHMGIETKKPKWVTRRDFQYCLTFTLLAKLAPAWNKVGDYLVQGRNFLTNSEKMNAVCMEVNVTEEKVCLAVQPNAVKLMSMKLEDLGVCPSVIQTFQESYPIGRICELSLENNWCRILPSMKKGQVVGILQQLPPGCPFQCYKDIKRYWKNAYGYRLPDTEQGFLYYQVYFSMIRDKLFTYPECCIRPRDLNIQPRVDSISVLDAFLSDLHRKLPSVCGQRLQFDPKPLHVTTQLYSIDQIKDIGRANLTHTIEAQKPTCFPETHRITQLIKPSSLHQIVNVDPGISISDTKTPNSTTQETKAAFSLPSTKTPSKDTQASQSNKQLKINSCLDTVENHKIAQEDNIAKPTSIKKEDSLTKHKKIIPVFQRKPYVHGGFVRQASSIIQHRGITKLEYDSTNSILTRVGVNADRETTQYHKCLPLTIDSQITCDPKESQGQCNLKRKLQTDEFERKTKRFSAKSKVMENIDIETLYKANQLGKVNTASLVYWLNQRGVRCHTKDKKQELLHKVLAVLHTAKRTEP